MTIIKIDNFGGELPRVSPRALGEAAQVNSNLLATSTEFRPLQADATITTAPAGAQTLYRMSRDGSGNLHTSDSAGWIAEATYKSYVKGQIADDATERTYVTFNDGSAAPRAIDATGQNRVLGVPNPASLTVALNAVDEFTQDDALAADTTVTAKISDAIKAAMVEGRYGNAINIVAPDALTIGWLAHGTSVTGTLPSNSANQVNFCVPVVGGVINEAFPFLKDARYGGNQITYGGNTFYTVAVDLYAPVYLPNGTTLAANLTAMKDPSDPAGTAALFDPAEVTSIVASCLDYWGLDKPQLKSVLDGALAATARLRDVIDSLGLPASYSTASYNTALAAFKGPSYAGAGEAFKRVFYAAAQYAALPAGGLVTTPSRYWINGGESTCYANLSADMATCINTDATGFHTFNYAKFSDLLKADFTILISQHTTDKQALMDALNATLEYCLVPYREFFSTAKQRSFGGSPKTEADKMLAWDSAVAEADAALAALTNRGALLYSQRDQAAINSYALGPQARLATAAVTRIIDTRFYIATHVTDWGEESAPCDPPDAVEVDQNDAVTLTLPAPPSGRNITKWRIYRSNSGTQGAAFQFVAEQATSDLTYEDTLKSAELGEVCPSIGIDGLTHWSEPATRLGANGLMSAKANPYLRGLVGMPNGIMAGFVDNFVAFCEPYHPYAWPLAYQVSLKFPIVGLGVFGNTLFVGTMGNPSLITGSDSASMSEQMLPESQACVSAKSIVSAGGGVLYASPDGICYASANGVEVTTTALFAREDWLALAPDSIVAVSHEGVYYFTFTGTYKGVTGGCLALDFVAKKLGRVDIAAGAMFADGLSDAVFYTSGTSIKKAFSTGRRTGKWRSAKVVLPAQTPFAWLQVDGDQSVGEPVTVRWYGDGSSTPKYTATVTGITPQRLPAGRYLEHEIEIESTARVTKVLLAGDTQELKSA